MIFPSPTSQLPLTTLQGSWVGMTVPVLQGKKQDHICDLTYLKSKTQALADASFRTLVIQTSCSVLFPIHKLFSLKDRRSGYWQTQESISPMRLEMTSQ